MKAQLNLDTGRTLSGPMANIVSPEWREILHLGMRREYLRGTVIKRPLDRIDHLYLVLEGEVHIHNFLAAGDNVPVMFAREKSLIGLIPFFTSGYCESYWNVMQNSVLCLFTREVVAEQLPRSFLMDMLEHMGWRARNTTNRACAQKSYNYETQLAQLLLHLLETCERVDNPRVEACVRPGVYQGELSKVLGIHRVHFSRLLAIWRKHGIIGKLTKNILEVKDLKILTALADGTVKLYSQKQSQEK